MTLRSALVFALVRAAHARVRRRDEGWSPLERIRRGRRRILAGAWRRDRGLHHRLSGDRVAVPGSAANDNVISWSPLWQLFHFAIRDDSVRRRISFESFRGGTDPCAAASALRSGPPSWTSSPPTGGARSHRPPGGDNRRQQASHAWTDSEPA